MSGTTSDNVGGVGIMRVECVIQRNVDKRYWSGRNWGTVSVRLPATRTGNTWVYTAMPSGANLKDDYYTLTAVAYDRSWNRGTAIIGVKVDGRGPVIKWTSPANGARLSALPSLTGRADDSYSGTVLVDTLIQRRSDRRFWNGRAWQVDSVRLPATRSGTPQLMTWVRRDNLPKGVNLPPGAYDLIAVAYDAFNNRTSLIITVNIVAAAARAVESSTKKSDQSTLAASPVFLSTATAGGDALVLQWSGALDITTAVDAARYDVFINGKAVAIESVQLSIGNRVTLGLESTFNTGDAIEIVWRELYDSRGQSVRDGTASPTAR